MARRKLDNARAHIEHCQVIFEGLLKYGWCPALEHEVRKARMIGAGILRKADARREAGNRKDIYVGR